MAVYCDVQSLTVDLYLDGALVKRDLALPIYETDNVIVRGIREPGYDIAQIVRGYLKAPGDSIVSYYMKESRPLNPNSWEESVSVDTWLVDCDDLDVLNQSYIAMNILTPGHSKCDKALLLQVDLFIDGKLFQRNARLQPVFDQYVSGLGTTADLLETARRYVNPNVRKMMGIIFEAEKRPEDLREIPWYAYGTYVTGGRSRPLVTCSRVLEYQKKYVAINLTTACKDDTLRMNISWRNEIVKTNFPVPIHYSHGERKFGESRVDLAQAVRAVIPNELLEGQDIVIQFFSRDREPDYCVNWSSRKPGKERLMATCEQIKMLKKRFIAVNLEPIITNPVGLQCSICPFNAEYHNVETNQFYCSLQCLEDSV
jgi:hypothetical protein